MIDINVAAHKVIALGRGHLLALGMILEAQHINAAETKIKHANGAEVTLYDMVNEFAKALDELEGLYAKASKNIN